jgi:hypothetical protein
MNAANTQTLANLLQIRYLAGLVRQFNDDFPLLRYIRQNSKAVDAQGEKARIALELGLNEGGGFHGESADVPDSGYPAIKHVDITLKQMTFRSRITYRLMRKAKTTSAAFARAASLQMSATREAFTLTANQYLWGDGTGAMARVVSWTPATRTLVLDRAYGIANGGAPEAIIRRGQVLHILDTNTYQDGVSADRGKGIVETVDIEGQAAGQVTVVIKAGHTLGAAALNDYVFLQNTIQGWTDSGETEDNRPIMGMLGFYDDTLVSNLQGLTDPSWKPSKVAVAEATVIKNLRTAKNRIAKRQNKGRIAFLISSYETHERYAAALDSKVEFRNVKTLDGYWDVGTFDGRPWFMDHTAPDGRTFFVPQGMTLARYAVDDFINLVDEDGSTLHQVPNKTVFDAMITAVMEYGISRRNTMISATGMTW